MKLLRFIIFYKCGKQVCSFPWNTEVIPSDLPEITENLHIQILDAASEDAEKLGFDTFEIGNMEITNVTQLLF